MLKWTRRMRISVYRPAKSVRHFGYSRLLMTSPFSDSIVFSVHTRKQRFQKRIVFKLLHSGERFGMALFSVIVFGVVVWTIAVSGAKQLSFRLKTDWCGQGLNPLLQTNQWQQFYIWRARNKRICEAIGAGEGSLSPGGLAVILHRSFYCLLFF